MSTPTPKQHSFGDWAIQLGFMTQDQVDHALSKKTITQQRLGLICMEAGFIDDEQLAQIVAARYSYPYAQLKGIDDPELLSLVPTDLMTAFQFIPYAKTDHSLTIAMAEPHQFLKVVDRLELMTDLDIQLVIVSEKKLKTLLKKLESSQNVLDTITDNMRLPLVRETDSGENILSMEKVSAEESPIVRLVDSTVLDAIHKGASDIHFEAAEAGMIIRYRIDGMLHQATEPLDIRHHSPIISRIKVMSELDISEKRIPQDGRFKVKVRDRYIDFRVSILPTIYGENAVIRILDRESLVAEAGDFRLDNMGLPEHEISRLRRIIQAPYGMFLMTGPTGSGKTTTLYRAISEINSKDTKIITIEDPVEYQLKGIMQIPVNEKKGLTFARGLRSILRHDPDKILVGEIRDAETAQIAIQSALTGHLVFTTVHANRSFEVINRFTHMGIKPYSLMSALNCIVAQRLIRVLCQCKVPRKPAEKELLQSGLDPALFRDRPFFTTRGCESCKGTGFRGRKAIIELVELDEPLREMLIKRAPASQLKAKAEEAGTTFLRKAAIREVLVGETTLKEANRVTFIELGENWNDFCCE